MNVQGIYVVVSEVIEQERFICKRFQSAMVKGWEMVSRHINSRFFFQENVGIETDTSHK